MQLRWVVAMWLAACNSEDAIEVAADAAQTVPADSGFSCVPVAPAAGPTCLALGAATLAGTTPLGAVDVALDYFGAGDCITSSRATIGLLGACGEAVSLQFSYPVTFDGESRLVEASFDATARFTLEPQGEAPRDQTTTIHVEVTKWQEGQGVHELDVVVTVTDPTFALAPLHIAGTFCDWPFYLC
jgi:hypothetical protein